MKYLHVDSSYQASKAAATYAAAAAFAVVLGVFADLNGQTAIPIAIATGIGISVFRSSLRGETPPFNPRWYCMTLINCLLIVGVYVGAKALYERNFEKSLVANFNANNGSVKLRFASVKNAMSPGCGCYEPKGLGGTQPDAWHGLSVPAESFTLNVDNNPGKSGNSSRVWQMTGMQPDVATFDWFDSPNSTISMKVTGTKGRNRVTVFNGRTTHFVVVNRDPIEVTGMATNPYTAVIPADDSEISIMTEPPSRSSRLSFGEIMVKNPKRNPYQLLTAGDEQQQKMSLQRSQPINLLSPQIELDTFEETFEPSIEVNQAFSAIDVLGKRIEIEVHNGSVTQVYAGQKLLTATRGLKNLRIKIDVPFSLRLHVSPAQSAWVNSMPNWFEKSRRQAIKKNDKVGVSATADGPEFTGRFLFDGDEEIPSHTVTLSSIIAPKRQQWEQFAKRSRSDKHDDVSSFIRPAKQDFYGITLYTLPPVESTMAIGAFGKLKSLESDTFDGVIERNGSTQSILRGQKVTLKSKDGLFDTEFRPSYMTVFGAKPQKTKLIGKGRVKVRD